MGGSFRFRVEGLGYLDAAHWRLAEKRSLKAGEGGEGHETRLRVEAHERARDLGGEDSPQESSTLIHSSGKALRLQERDEDIRGTLVLLRDMVGYQQSAAQQLPLAATFLGGRAAEIRVVVGV